MILLDTRELNHPIPLEMATEAFKRLMDGEVIHMIHRREPIPLFEIVTKNGGRFLSREEEGTWHIYITRDPKINLEVYRV